MYMLHKTVNTLKLRDKMTVKERQIYDTKGVFKLIIFFEKFDRTIKYIECFDFVFSQLFRESKSFAFLIINSTYYKETMCYSKVVLLHW